MDKFNHLLYYNCYHLGWKILIGYKQGLIEIRSALIELLYMIEILGHFVRLVDYIVHVPFIENGMIPTIISIVHRLPMIKKMTKTERGI